MQALFNQSQMDTLEEITASRSQMISLLGHQEPASTPGEDLEEFGVKWGHAIGSVFKLDVPGPHPLPVWKFLEVPAEMKHGASWGAKEAQDWPP